MGGLPASVLVQHSTLLKQLNIQQCLHTSYQTQVWIIRPTFVLQQDIAQYCSMLLNIFFNVRHKSTYAGFAAFATIFSLHCQGALQTLELPGSIVAQANSGQFLSSLLSDHSTAAQRCGRRSRISCFFFTSISDHYVRTLVLSAGSSRENARYYATLALFA